MANAPANKDISCAAYSVTVIPSDSTIIGPCRGFYVGVTGDVAVRMLDGTTPIFKAVPAGKILPFQIDKVLATGTTATDIIGVW